MKNSEEAPERYKCLTNFVQLRESFGRIVSAWMKKREQFGPGFYLYLGTRRGTQLYSEHRFVNLIWGIEAFHRKKGLASESTEIKPRVSRILDQIGDEKDKEWLGKRLRNAPEPNLEQRIFDLFTEIPISIEEKRLRCFVQECVARRRRYVGELFCLSLRKIGIA